MINIFKVITNLSSDTKEIREALTNYIVNMLVSQYSTEVVDLFIEKLEAEWAKDQ